MKFSNRWEILFQRNEGVTARLVADHSSDMAAPGCVFRKHHVAGSETANRAVAGFDLDLPRERDDILALRHSMIVAQMTRRCRTKDDPMGGFQRGCFQPAIEAQFHIDLFEVRFVVRSGVKSDDLHLPVCKRITWEKQANEAPAQRKHEKNLTTKSAKITKRKWRAGFQPA